MIKKLPYGISNYEELITENYYYYVDKTMYIEKQEEAKKPIEEYANFEEIKNIKNLKKYIIVVVVDKIFLEEIF